MQEIEGNGTSKKAAEHHAAGQALTVLQEKHILRGGGAPISPGNGVRLQHRLYHGSQDVASPRSQPKESPREGLAALDSASQPVLVSSLPKPSQRNATQVVVLVLHP